MQFAHVDRARIEREWPAIAEVLAPAVEIDPKQTIEGLRERLRSGADSLIEVSGPGSALIVLEVCSDLVCWTKYMAGRIEGSPKARLAILRRAVSHIETVAKAAGCIEHRLCGRQAWARILPDYRPFDGQQNGLMKELV